VASSAPQTLRPPGAEVETANDQGRSGPGRGFLELQGIDLSQLFRR
jgi:hypothetical protein